MTPKNILALPAIFLGISAIAPASAQTPDLCSQVNDDDIPSEVTVTIVSCQNDPFQLESTFTRTSDGTEIMIGDVVPYIAEDGSTGFFTLANPDPAGMPEVIPAANELFQNTDPGYYEAIGLGFSANNVNFNTLFSRGTVDRQLSVIQQAASNGGIALSNALVGSQNDVVSSNSPTLQLVGIADMNGSGLEETLVSYDPSTFTLGYGELQLSPQSSMVPRSFSSRTLPASASFDQDGQTYSVDFSQLKLWGVADLDNDGFRDDVVGGIGFNIVVIPGDDTQDIRYYRAPRSFFVNGIISGAPTLFAAGGDLDNDGWADDFLFGWSQNGTGSQLDQTQYVFRSLAVDVDASGDFSIASQTTGVEWLLGDNVTQESIVLASSSQAFLSRELDSRTTGPRGVLFELDDTGTTLNISKIGFPRN